MGTPGSLNPALKLTYKVPERGKKAGGRQGTAGTWEGRGKRRKGGGKPQGRQRGGKGQHGGRGGGRGDKSPKETPARDPTSGVGGPPW